MNLFSLVLRVMARCADLKLFSLIRLLTKNFRYRLDKSLRSRSEQFYWKIHCDSRKLYLAEDFTPKADIGFSSKMLREFE